MAGTALTKFVPRLITAENTRKGLAGVLQKMLGGQGIKGTGIVGTIAIGAAATSVQVSDPGYAAGDQIIAIPQGQSTNPCYYVGYSAAVAGTGYTLNVNTAPGAGGLTLLVIRLPAALFFAS